jgi:hypothetical protein
MARSGDKSRDTSKATKLPKSNGPHFSWSDVSSSDSSVLWKRFLPCNAFVPRIVMDAFAFTPAGRFEINMNGPLMVHGWTKLAPGHQEARDPGSLRYCSLPRGSLEQSYWFSAALWSLPMAKPACSSWLGLWGQLHCVAHYQLIVIDALQFNVTPTAVDREANWHWDRSNRLYGGFHVVWPCPGPMTERTCPSHLHTTSLFPRENMEIPKNNDRSRGINTTRGKMTSLFHDYASVE